VLYLHSASTPSWRGAHLKYRDNFNLPINDNEFFRIFVACVCSHK